MNIPQSAIRPFEPHGLPKLNFIKDMDVSNLRAVLDVMAALDKFIEQDGESFFSASSILTDEQLRALAVHFCTWLEKVAMEAGADTVRAQSRAISIISDGSQSLQSLRITGSPETKHKVDLIGFMFLIDFSVGDEKLNHLLEFRFRWRKM